MGREALPEEWVGLGGYSKGLVRVGKPSRRDDGVGWPSRRSGKGQVALPEGWEMLGSPSGEL